MLNRGSVIESAHSPTNKEKSESQHGLITYFASMQKTGNHGGDDGQSSKSDFRTTENENSSC
jgi:hypothetical protein